MNPVSLLPHLVSFRFNVHGSVHRKNITIYIQNKMLLLKSLFYRKTTLRVSGGASTHHQERIQLYLQHLAFVTPLLLPAAIAAGSSNGMVTHVKTGPGVHPASCTMGTGSFPGVKSGRSVMLTSHPF
jgi:hypothetical protein